ncbi:MAG TPA: 16S rRNA (guanine(966)-N(2))-methyltransferase RsmD [Candidatus Dormibacteraeota bacterium]|nr:16S rRNA (guanine(966)-N(2))-methyltransferase RsmD [Candidatus Dormibacteraeota bacterium]
MRIVAGKYGSRHLKSPGKLRLRPTSDRLRETLFDILGPQVESARFIDAYAGTGAVGIEALSRGAQRAIFLEIAKGAAALIRENLEMLGAGADAEILHGDALRGLARLHARGERADFIFLDPPYEDAEAYRRALEFLGHSAPLAPRGAIVIEHASTFALPEFIGKIECARRVHQGDATLSFYRLMPGG